MTRTTERLGGFALALVGAGLVALIWRQVTADGTFSLAGAMTGPAFGVVGLALLAVPGYRSERLARGESPDAFEGLDVLTPRWKAILALAVAAGVLHLLLLRWGVLPV